MLSEAQGGTMRDKFKINAQFRSPGGHWSPVLRIKDKNKSAAGRGVWAAHQQRAAALPAGQREPAPASGTNGAQKGRRVPAASSPSSLRPLVIVTAMTAKPDRLGATWSGVDVTRSSSPKHQSLVPLQNHAIVGGLPPTWTAPGGTEDEGALV